MSAETYLIPDSEQATDADVRAAIPQFEDENSDESSEDAA